MGWPHLLARALSSAEAGEEDHAAASLTTVQLIATAFGAAITGVVTSMAGIHETGNVASTKHAAWVLFVAFAVLPLLTLTIVRTYFLKQDVRRDTDVV